MPVIRCYVIFTGNQKLLKCNKVWADFLDHYGSRGCVVDSEKFPPQPQHVLEKKKKKKSRKVEAMDEGFYRGTDQDPIKEEEDRPE